MKPSRYLDYSHGCVNFRDVGEWVNLFADREVLPHRHILRGGKLDAVTNAEDIANPGTICNLRRGPDSENKRFAADYRHFPIANDYEKYHTTEPMVRRWLSAIFRSLAEHPPPLPVFFHCTSGKDRTGVVVAALLIILGIDRQIVVQEYLVSDEVKQEWIEIALDGIADPAVYFRRVNLAGLRFWFLGK